MFNLTNDRFGQIVDSTPSFGNEGGRSFSREENGVKRDKKGAPLRRGPPFKWSGNADQLGFAYSLRKSHGKGKKGVVRGFKVTVGGTPFLYPGSQTARCLHRAPRGTR